MYSRVNDKSIRSRHIIHSIQKGVPGSGKLEYDHSAYILDCYMEAKQHFDQSKHSQLNIPMSESDSKAEKEDEPEFNKEIQTVSDQY